MISRSRFLILFPKLELGVNQNISLLFLNWVWSNLIWTENGHVKSHGTNEIFIYVHIFIRRTAAQQISSCLLSWIRIGHAISTSAAMMLYITTLKLFFRHFQFLSALAALYLTLVSQWVTHCHFRISTQIVTFETWDPSDIWSECVTERQKDRKTERLKDRKTERQKYRKTKRQKDNKDEDKKRKDKKIKTKTKKRT